MSTIDASAIWSNTDFPYQCLRDHGRTTTLLQAVSALVRPGDVVVDVGAGTGILSLAAAKAGAARVVAVEVEPVLAASLRATVSANGFASVIEVVEDDARCLDGLSADVLLAELIDTALVDELFVPVMNHLWAGGTVGPHTRLLFESYVTTAQLVVADHEYYGFTILAPKHEWPFLDAGHAGSRWSPSSWRTTGPAVELGSWDFRRGPVDPDVGPVAVPDDAEANAVLLSGQVRLGDGQVLGAYNTFNGVKVLALPPHRPGAGVRVSYRMGAGLSSLRIDRGVPVAAEPVIDLRAPVPPAVPAPAPATAAPLAAPSLGA